MKSEDWVRRELERLAATHFGGRAEPLEAAVLELAFHHEWIWRRRGATNFRPTASMYALALSWELDQRGPACAFCREEVGLGSGTIPARATGRSLALGPRVPPTKGGLNVPQNLALSHANCLPTW